MIELFSPPFRSIVVNREAVIDPAHAAARASRSGGSRPEALYIGHAERKRAYEWQAIRVEEIVLGRSRACLL
jgi:hypothetical protein